MKIRLSRRAVRDFESLSLALQGRVTKQFGILLADLRHPSLRAKKYDERQGVWHRQE